MIKGLSSWHSGHSTFRGFCSVRAVGIEHFYDFANRLTQRVHDPDGPWFVAAFYRDILLFWEPERFYLMETTRKRFLTTRGSKHAVRLGMNIRVPFQACDLRFSPVFA